MKLKKQHSPYIARKITKDIVNSPFIELRKEKSFITAECERILVEDIQKEIELDDAVDDLLEKQEEDIEFYKADYRQLFWMTKKRMANDFGVNLNFEDRFSNIAHLIMDYLYEEDFIHFIVNNLPKGIIGLLLAVILAAAMSSTASELNSLASTTTIDVYKRNLAIGRDESHYVKASKWLTLAWGILAIIIACIADLFDNLIQLVNIIGSLFYGNVLGIFLLAFFFKRVQGNAVFIAAIITEIIILLIYYFGIYQPEELGLAPVISYLWLNFVGCILVIYIALMHSFTQNQLKIKITLMLISIAFIKTTYDAVYLGLTLYHVLVLLFLFLLTGILSIEKKPSIL